MSRMKTLIIFSSEFYVNNLDLFIGLLWWVDHQVLLKEKGF